MRDGHPFVISCTDNNQRMRDRIRRKPKPGKERTNESGSERIPSKQPRPRRRGPHEKRKRTGIDPGAHDEKQPRPGSGHGHGLPRHNPVDGGKHSVPRHHPVRDRNRAPMRRRTRAGTRGEDDARIPRDRLHPRKRTRCQRLPEHHGTPAPMEDPLANITPDIAMGTCGINEGNRRGKQ